MKRKNRRFVGKIDEQVERKSIAAMFGLEIGQGFNPVLSFDTDGFATFPFDFLFA
jgi:hypothetical protein